jgi:trehalose 6-phosphate synthase
MSRLVVVSNRVADPRKAAAGGLAVALGDSLNATGGLWFGWSGKSPKAAQPAKVSCTSSRPATSSWPRST